MSSGGSGWGDLSAGAKFGVWFQGFSMLSGAMSAGHAAAMERIRFKSLALNLQHQKDMTLFNMEATESQAQHLSRTFNVRNQIMTLKQGNVKSKGAVSIASRGGQRGVGSNLDAMVSSEMLAEIDRINMNSNKVRAVENQRLQGVGLGIKAHMLDVSSQNMFRTASAVSPAMNMTSTFLTGASDLAKYFA